MKFFEHPSFLVLSSDRYRPFSDLADGIVFPPEVRRKLIRRAETAAAREFPLLPVTGYLEFARNGNRSRYEAIYFDRRRRLFSLILGEVCERQGRWLDRIADDLWAICEETSWVIPAHNVALDETLLSKPLPDAYGDTVVAIDLFSATTAAVIAWGLYLLGDALDAQVTPMIRERALYELQRRIVRPYLRYTMRWITAFVNNWCPWIVSNVLSVTALTVRDDAQRRAVIERSLEFLDVFTATYDPDGGCDEGPSYWGMAGGAWFDALEQLFDMTGGTVDVFGTDFCRRVGEYIADMHITGDYFVNFADCPVHLQPNAGMVRRFGKRTGSRKLAAFGASLPPEDPELPDAGFAPYRTIKNLCQTIQPEPESARPDAICYDGLQVAVLRGQRLFAAIKGGHNYESHNHNDVGHLIVYADGEPFLIDAGPDTYTSDTFNENRYTLWNMQSCWHNLPTVNGCDQRNGTKFRADRFDCDAAARRVTVGFAGAYPEEAGLTEAVRTLTLSDRAVTVRDVIRCKKAAAVCWNFLLPDRPEPIPGGVRLGPVTLTADLPCRVEIDRRELAAGGNLNKNWKRDALWRVRFLPADADTFDAGFTVSL